MNTRKIRKLISQKTAITPPNIKKWTKKSMNSSHTVLSTSWDYTGFLEFCNIYVNYILYTAMKVVTFNVFDYSHTVTI